MAKKQMWLGSVLAPSGGAQPLLLALMDNGGSPGKKGNAYTVLAVVSACALAKTVRGGMRSLWRKVLIFAAALPLTLWRYEQAAL